MVGYIDAGEKFRSCKKACVQSRPKGFIKEISFQYVRILACAQPSAKKSCIHFICMDAPQAVGSLCFPLGGNRFPVMFIFCQFSSPVHRDFLPIRRKCLASRLPTESAYEAFRLNAFENRGMMRLERSRKKLSDICRAKVIIQSFPVSAPLSFWAAGAREKCCLRLL